MATKSKAAVLGSSFLFKHGNALFVRQEDKSQNQIYEIAFAIKDIQINQNNWTTNGHNNQCKNKIDRVWVPVLKVTALNNCNCFLLASKCFLLAWQGFANASMLGLLEECKQKSDHC